MNWDLLGIVPMIFIALMAVICLWGSNQMRKTGNKFLTFVFIVLAVAMGILFYALYGKKIFG